MGDRVKIIDGSDIYKKKTHFMVAGKVMLVLTASLIQRTGEILTGHYLAFCLVWRSSSVYFRLYLQSLVQSKMRSLLRWLPLWSNL